MQRTWHEEGAVDGRALGAYQEAQCDGCVRAVSAGRARDGRFMIDL